ncbi:TetR/AcrR family transcriptional regulator [Sphingomicrobium clamense]|uniref:TetR family transcriptional regulator n=1 Tax=Sphingomicrobium clamense TaxID=2851013 RepID=A0ABS6V6I3_9SPHN|nr:TetR/AcrR family transcriptional regulator [Sphingomicrobium sp. B8]MBW0145174.1 TetR family transcriptional regulator [Sphingomicrobium sp. B8]
MKKVTTFGLWRQHGLSATVLPMGKVKRQARSDDTRSAIMAAGTRLFAVQGFEKTGIRDIAVEADVNPALISYHFGGKEGLIEEIFADAIDTAAEAVEDGRFVDAEFPEKELVRLYAKSLSSQPMLVLMSLRSQLDPERVFNENLLPLYRRFRTLTNDMLDTLPDDAPGKTLDPNLVYSMILSPLQMYFAAHQIREGAKGSMEPTASSLPPEEFVQRLGDFISAALR